MKSFGNILWGIVLIVVGLIIGGNALGITNINIFFDGWWTLFIIVPCLIGLFKEREKTGNIIGLLIGIALLLCCQDILDFDMIWKLALPVVLIIIGISFIFKDTFNHKINEEIKKLNENRTKDGGYCATFAGQNIKFDGEKFNGTELTAVFGGVKCDLTKGNKDNKSFLYSIIKYNVLSLCPSSIELGSISVKKFITGSLYCCIILDKNS